MSPAVAVLSAWILFGGSHLLLSTPALRERVANRLGQHRFLFFYALITTTSLGLLIGAVAYYGGDGLPGANLGTVPVARWALGGAALFGGLLLVAGIMNYPRSPMAVLARRWRASTETRGKPLPARAVVERITRHGFFVGLAILMAAHALLASTLAGAVFFGGFVLMVLIGIPMQDRKLLERHGSTYGDYLSKTSVVPFAAMPGSTGDAKQRVWPTIAIAVTGTAVLAALHPLWHLGHGAPFAVIVLIGGLAGVVKQLRRGTRPMSEKSGR